MLDAKDRNKNSFAAKVYPKLAMQVKAASRVSHFYFLLFEADTLNNQSDRNLLAGSTNSYLKSLNNLNIILYIP